MSGGSRTRLETLAPSVPPPCPALPFPAFPSRTLPIILHAASLSPYCTLPPPPSPLQVGVDFPGELREVIQLVEEVMRRMREIYGADREVGDMSLGSITQFVYRKLRWGEGRGKREGGVELLE